jgi:hypothetical protein
MEFLELFSKILAWPSRIGAAAVLVAVVVYILRATQIDPISSLDATYFQYIVLVGIIGAAFVLVNVGLSIVPRTINLISNATSAWQTSRARQQHAEQALAADHPLQPEFEEVLWYLRTNGIKRFASKSNGTLYVMEAECLLDHYAPGYAMPLYAYYRVPGYVWRQIDQRLRSKFGGRNIGRPVALSEMRPP